MAPTATSTTAASPLSSETTSKANGAPRDDSPSIPLISFASLIDSSASKEQSAQALLDAFQTSGFLYLTDYTSLISSDLLKKVFKQSALFFALPFQEKDALAWTTPRANRGYTRMGQEKTSNGMTQAEVEEQRAAEGGDLKESFEIGREDDEGYPNRWIDHLSLSNEGNMSSGAEFRQTMQEFFEVCKKMHRILMSALAVGLRVSPDFFDPFTRLGDNTLRLLHYPPVPAGGFENGKRVRAGAHTDYGSLTLLFQDARGGLQVDPEANNGWLDVRPREGTIVVNAGDLLGRWSSDLIRSTRHRVVEPSAARHEGYPARYSIAYFCNPDFDGWIEAIPGTYEEGKGRKKYEGVNSGNYLEARLSATY